MQVQGKGIPDADKRAYRAAIVKGLRNKYKILSGDSVDATVQEIFEKESRENIECDTEKCFQDIAIAFQAELIAVTSIVKKSGGYLLTLQINNVLENENVLSESVPCRGCDEFQVIDQLILMAGGKPSAPIAQAQVPQPQASTPAPPKPTPESPPKGMVFVKGGCFDMGDVDEKLEHKVCLDDFYMDKYEVTQSNFQNTMGSNPSRFKGCNNCPVEQVTWYKAKNYCEKVGKRLPTEAEWEYAARSGGKSEKYAGTSDNPDRYAWYARNSGKKTHPVSQKQPNGLGLYDMSGNVWEWVSDRYGKDYYNNSPENNPGGPSSGKYRVMRGGSWRDVTYGVRVSLRSTNRPVILSNIIGFRCSQ